MLTELLYLLDIGQIYPKHTNLIEVEAEVLPLKSKSSV